jgi:hypothetical protein
MTTKTTHAAKAPQAINSTPAPRNDADLLEASSNKDDARMRARCMKLEEHELRAINVDVRAACQLLRRVAKNLAPLADEVIEVIPSFEREWITDLGPMAAFTLMAYAASNQVEASKIAQEMLVECNALRKDLQSWARSCRDLGFLESTRLDEFERMPYGYTDTPYVLVQLVLLFNADRASLSERVTLQWDRIDAARDMANRLGDLAGIDGKPEPSPEARDLAVRAFTQMVNTYDECRWAVAYVRRHVGDASTITPPYGNRSTGKPGSRDEELPSPGPTPEPVEPVRPRSLRGDAGLESRVPQDSPWMQDPLEDGPKK